MSKFVALVVIALCVAAATAHQEKDPYDFKCPACKAAVGYVQSMLLKGNTTDQIKTFIVGWCVKSFGKWAPNVCDQVDSKIDAMITDLKNGDLPQNVCNKVGLCLDSVDVDYECPACKYAVRFVADLLEQGKTAEQIETELHAECMTVFGTSAPYVCELLDNEVANMIAYIESGEAPAAVCKLIKLCPATKPAPAKDAYDFTCPACKAAVAYIQSMLIKGNTTDQIATFIHGYCIKTFGAWAPNVCDVIDMKVDSMIAYIKAGELPQNVCGLVGICVEMDVDYECPACKYAVKYAVQLLKSGTAAEQVEKMVHDECMTVFGTSAPYVCELLDNEIKSIIAYIEAGDAPAVICQKLKFCKTAPAADIKIKKLTCAPCKAVIGHLKKYATKTVSDSQILNEASSYCNSIVPVVGKPVCKALLHMGAQKLASLIRGTGDSKAICHSMKMC